MQFFEQTAERYLPYLGHWPSDDVVLLKDGSLLAMGRLRGVPHELAAASERNAASHVLNSLWRQLADDKITLGMHLVRWPKLDQLPRQRFHNDFGRRFDTAYREQVLGGLYENAWFLSLVAAPRSSMGNQKEFGREISRLIRRFRRPTAPQDPSQITILEDLWLTLSRSLEGYQLQRLGIRNERGVLFSEIAEALRLILYCTYLPVGITDGPLGHAIYTDRAVFDRRHYRLLHPESVQCGAIFGLREYMASTRPGMLDAVLPLPMPLTLSQSFGYLPRQDAVARLARKQNQMVAGNDRAFAQIADIDNALSDVAGGEVARGMHHVSLAVYADSFLELEQAAGLARSELADTGAVAAQETMGMQAAWFAQLPGNLDWRTRPGVISTKNLSHFADFGSFPAGAREGRWGQAIIRLRTVGQTAYDFIPHVDDVGMTVIFGRTGSGKTTFLGSMLTMFDQCIGDDGVIFLFDKDRGCELLVRAVEGSYIEIRSGVASGMAPLRRLQNKPADREFLVRWIKGLVHLDGHGPLPPQDDGRLSRAVAAIMRKPPELRSLHGLRQYLTWRDPLGAGARLERWCDGNGFGWAFDGDMDEVDISKRVVGFDLTAILDDPDIVTPAAQYLLYLVAGAIDGRRAVISLDECRAYMLHDQFRDCTEDFLLRGRKNNAVVILVTQEPEHLLDGTFGATLVRSCMTKIFFRNPTADADVHRGQLFLTEGELRAIREDMLPGSRQCLIKRDSGSVIVDFDLSAIPEFVSVFSGRARTVRFAERLRQESPENWVTEYQRRYREAVD